MNFSACFSAAHSLITAHHGSRSEFAPSTALTRLSAQSPSRPCFFRPSTSPAQSTSANRRRRIPSGAYFLIHPSKVVFLRFHSCSVFETTIRYLGGLLSAYEQSDKQFPILLQKAKEVGDKLVFAWVGVRHLRRDPRRVWKAYKPALTITELIGQRYTIRRNRFRD